MRRWFNDLVSRAARAIEDGASINDDIDPDILRQAVEPTQFETILKAAAAWEDLVERLRELFDDEELAAAEISHDGAAASACP